MKEQFFISATSSENKYVLFLYIFLYYVTRVVTKNPSHRNTASRDLRTGVFSGILLVPFVSPELPHAWMARVR